MSSADENDPNVGWTVQSGNKMPDPYDKSILHSVTTAQLPDAEVQRAAGIDPDAWAANGLVVVDEPVAEEPKKKGGSK